MLRRQLAVASGLVGAFAVAVHGCNRAQDAPDEPVTVGTVEAEQTITTSDTQDSTLAMGDGMARTQLTIPARAAPPQTKLTVRLASNVMKAGPAPANGRAIQILPRGVS